MARKTRPSRTYCKGKTAKGKRCRGQAKKGTDRCPHHTAPVKHRTKLEIDIEENKGKMRGLFLGVINVGAGRDAACREAGISRQTLWEWIKRGGEGEEPFTSFLDDLQKAEGRDKIEYLQAIHRAAKAGKWRAAAWALERRWPKEFGMHYLRADVNVTTSKPDLSGLTDEELALARTLMDKVKHRGATDGQAAEVQRPDKQHQPKDPEQ